MKKAVAWLATWFGCGLSPRGPGTVGTLGALPVVYLLQRLGAMPYLMATLLFAVIAVLVSQFYEDLWAQQHDPQEIVIDEVAGFLVAMTWLPFSGSWVALAFVIFRFFDILKPFPISWIDQNIKGGVGTVADDLLAGIFTNVLLQVLLQKGWFL